MFAGGDGFYKYAWERMREAVMFFHHEVISRCRGRATVTRVQDPGLLSKFTIDNGFGKVRVRRRIVVMRRRPIAQPQTFILKSIFAIPAAPCPTSAPGLEIMRTHVIEKKPRPDTI